MASNKIKICRHCHTVYNQFSQKYCGNGCERKAPYFTKGKKNTDIEKREVSLPEPKDDEIRWICINCKQEYSLEDFEERDNKCTCGVVNQIYPFSIKQCNNDKCKSENILHELPINAKVCDLCGENNFLLNNSKETAKFIIQKKKSVDLWEGLKEFHFSKRGKEEINPSDMISVNFSILNNNYEIQIYGSDYEISIAKMLKNAPGFIPNSIYRKYISIYGLSTPIFTIIFHKSTQSYSFQSIIDTEMIQLDAKLTQKGVGTKLSKNTIYDLKENDFLLVKADFFKIRLWVY